MARARNIKPGFFINDELAELEPLARILFAGLWCIADREGRLEDRPKKIKAEVLPYDDCDVDKFLNDLQEHGFIIRYEVDGNRYIQVVNFNKHQNPHVKEAASIIPPPPNNEPAPEKHCASTVQEPEKHTTNPADSLNLIPDSLNPIKVVSKDTTKDADSEGHKDKSEDDVSSKELIASLTAYYQSVTGSTDKKDFPFIGGLYNRYGYDTVWAAIDDLKIRLSATPIDQPRSYIIGILRSPNTGPKKNSTNKQPETSYPYQYINSG
jgi:hypothetical protein